METNPNQPEKPTPVVDPEAGRAYLEESSGKVVAQLMRQHIEIDRLRARARIYSLLQTGSMIAWSGAAYSSLTTAESHHGPMWFALIGLGYAASIGVGVFGFKANSRFLAARKKSKDLNSQLDTLEQGE